MRQMYLFRLIARTKPVLSDKGEVVTPAGAWIPVSSGFSDRIDDIPPLPRGVLAFDPEAFESRIIRDVMDVIE
jgi:hypothetical protein